MNSTSTHSKTTKAAKKPIVASPVSAVVFHNIPPVFDANSKVLILGSFPSVKSRDENFFYAHKQNRFWRVVATVFDSPIPESVNEKKLLLLKNGIALWDVVSSCKIAGSADSSIIDVKPNDLSKIFDAAKIQRVFCNGNRAFDLYQKYMLPRYKIPATKLPSTSPANARFSAEKLVEAWKVVRL